MKRYEVWIDCREGTTATGATSVEYTHVSDHETMEDAVAAAPDGAWVLDTKTGEARRVGDAP